MFSSIQPKYSTPPPSAPPSVTLQRRRARTTSEPPVSTYDAKGNRTHTARHFLYKNTRDNGTNSLSSMTGKPLALMRANRQAGAPASPILMPRELGSIRDSQDNLFNIEQRLSYFEQNSDGTLIVSHQNSNVISEDSESDASDDSGDFVVLKNGKEKIGVSFIDVPARSFPKYTVMESKLLKIFSPFTTAGNKKNIEMLVTDRCKALSESSIGPEDLEQMLKNADRVDNMTARFFGGLSALGFILGGHATINLTPIMGANLPIDLLPYMPGGITGIADRILSSILTDTHVGYYTKDNPAALEEVMQENLERFQRPLIAELTHQAGALSWPYSFRNVVRSIAAPVAAHFDQTAIIDLMIDGCGGIPAGAQVRGLCNDGDRQDLLMHSAYLLAQKNWKSQLEELRHTPFSHQRIMRLINRTCAGSTKIPDILFNACKRLITIDSATEISLLMLGFACNEWLKETAANEFEEASPEVSAFLKNSVGTFFLGTLYCSLSVAMTGASRLTQFLACRQENTNRR
jgi:hypothetical protein